MSTLARCIKWVNRQTRNSLIPNAIAATLLCCLSTALIINSLQSITPSNLCHTQALTPWKSVGGCGAASGSQASEAQLKWIGRGLSGSLIDVEAQFTHSLVSDTAMDTAKSYDGHIRVQTTSLALSLLFHPIIMDVRLFVPLSVRRGFDVTTGVLGDMSLDISHNWGPAGALQTGLLISVPTGRYDIPRTDFFDELPEMQLGSGLFGGSIRLQYTLDRDWGIVAAGTSYSLGLFAVKTTEFDYDTAQGTVVEVSRRLQNARLHGGAVNDVGTIRPDVLSLFCDLGIKAESLVHGLGFGLSFPRRDGGYVEPEKYVNNSFTTTEGDDDFYSDKQSAQDHAESMTDEGGELMFEDPLVVGVDNRDRWVVMERTHLTRSASPSMNLQYSMEKSDLHVPIMLGGSVQLALRDGVSFSGFTAGVGVKFRVY